MKILLINFGCIHWRFIQKFIVKNPHLEQIALEGICNFNSQNETRDAFDWQMFENCRNLKSFEIACPPFVNSRENDQPIPSINFTNFPCSNIEEFYVYKVEMSPEDVRRVYSEMHKLSSGSLNQIGEQGTETATEMFWVHAHHQEAEGHDWMEGERWWDIMTNSILGISLLSVLFAISRSHPIMTEDDEYS